MVKVNFIIDGKEMQAESGTTVLQACRSLDIEVPVFCYHKTLSIAGNCRMCLVEQEKVGKPIASCSTPVSQGMVIHTDSPMVKKAREGALEFLLINHPLDCPICDQGGECDLQDITRGYSRHYSRFNENKRVVEDKDFGPIIKTVLTRCIHCTRCVRFSTEIAGVPEMGALGRGENMEIASYIEHTLSSEFSGNVIDLCPVGALTFKPYEFKARSWELKSTDSIDVSDAVGAHIRIDSRDDEIMRILPRTCPDLNEEWITDKTRLLYEGLKVQRLDRPYMRIDGKLKACEWTDALEYIAGKMKSISPDKIAGFVGPLVDAESMFALKTLFQSLNISNIESRLDGEKIGDVSRDWYTFNTCIADLDHADMCLIIGANLRYEAPLINLRLRKAHLTHKSKIFVIGEKLDLTYPYTYLGDDLNAIDGEFNFERLHAIVGSSVLARDDIYSILAKLKERFSLNVLHKDASRVAALDLEVFSKTPIDIEKMEMFYLLGVDDDHLNIPSDAFVVYQGHHGEKGAERADVVLPGLTFAEKSGTYINLEGYTQRTNVAVAAPGCAKEDWKIIRALSGLLDSTLPFNTLEELRLLMDKALQEKKDAPSTVLEKGGIKETPVTCIHGDFYQADIISRHSVTLREVSKMLKGIKA